MALARKPCCAPPARALLFATLLCGVATAAAGATPLYLSPRLEVASGATSNRFLTPQAEGAPYLRLAPALEALWFGAGGREVSAGIHHATTRFARPGFASQDETRARVTLWQPLPAADLSATAEGGVYRDGAVPTDDAGWFGVEGSLQALPINHFSPSLAARWSTTHFDKPVTTGDADRVDRRWSLAPTLSWLGWSNNTLWTEALWEDARSTAAEDSYRGFGLATGGDTQRHGTLNAGLWARWLHRRYPGGRSDTATSAGVWGRLRLTAWAEFTADGHAVDHHSTSPLDTYQEWGVEAGVQLRYDWLLSR